jgi:hypothetical protein
MLISANGGSTTNQGQVSFECNLLAPQINSIMQNIEATTKKAL